MVKDGNVVRREIPKGIHIAADGAQVRAARVKVVDATVSILYVFLIFCL